MDSIYSYPHYYEIAFSYRDIPGEVDVMEQAMAKYSKIPVKTVLELACGNGPHMLEFMDRGYEYWGLDLNPTMIEFAREKAASKNHTAKFYLADLADFRLDEPADFLYIMMGSCTCGTQKSCSATFPAPRRVSSPAAFISSTGAWTLSPVQQLGQLGYAQTGHYGEHPLQHPPAQCSRSSSTRRASSSPSSEKGQERTLLHQGLRRAIFPQEFILAATKLHKFEFIGWWNDWDLKVPLGEGRGEIVRPITVLRRL